VIAEHNFESAVSPRSGNSFPPPVGPRPKYTFASNLSRTAAQSAALPPISNSAALPSSPSYASQRGVLLTPIPPHMGPAHFACPATTEADIEQSTPTKNLFAL